jgi:hypothetical protein
VVLAGSIAGATFLVHDVPQILSQPYWLDEAWVADSTRVPLSQVPSLTSATPIGWTLALRLVVLGGPQRHRLLPLLLLAGAVVLAYLIGRRAPLPAPVGGSVTALAVLLLPHTLVRSDLKQYTGDACCALLILWLAVRAEERLTRGRLAALALAVPGTLLFSYTGAFVGASALLALALATLLRRRRPELLRVLVAGAAAAVAMGVVYLVAIRPHVIESLTDYWKDYFPPVDQGPGAVARFVLDRLHHQTMLTNLGPGPVMALVLAAGLATMVLVRRLALALSVPILAVTLFGAAALHRYPLLDTRTSLFWFVILAVVAAFGLAGSARAGYELVRRGANAASRVVGRRVVTARPAAGRRAVAVLGALVAAAILTGGATVYAANPVRRYVRDIEIPSEDTRSATNWLRDRLGPGDVLVMNASAAYAYAYYARDFRPAFVPTAAISTGFVPASDPAQRVIVVARSDRTAPSIPAAVAQARALLGPAGHVFVFQSHLHPADWEALHKIGPITLYRWPGAVVGVLLP